MTEIPISTRWWVAVGDERRGPFSRNAILLQLESEETLTSQLACPVGGNEWKPIEDWGDVLLIDDEAIEHIPPPPPIPKVIATKTKGGNKRRANATEPLEQKDEADQQSEIALMPAAMSISATAINPHRDQPHKVQVIDKPDVEPPETDDVDEGKVPNDTTVESWIGGLFLGGIVILTLIGWSNVLWAVCWVIVIVAGISTLQLALAGWNSENENSQVGLILGAMACAGVAILVFQFVRPTSNSAVNGVGSQYAGTNADPVTRSTLAYWNAIPQFIDRSGVRTETYQQMTGFYRHAATRIEQLPTQNVDPIAVEWALEAAASLRHSANTFESISIGQQQAVMRSLVYLHNKDADAGLRDFAQTVGSISQASANARNQLVYVWNQKSAQARAKLTSKYGTEFPAIFW